MDRYDGLVLVGLGMVGVGLWWVYPPLALIVPGAFLATLGVVMAVRQEGRAGKEEDEQL